MLTPGRKGGLGATPAKSTSVAAQARRNLSEEQRAELKEAFDLFDTEKSGKIDYHELKVARRAMGFECKKAEAVKLIEEHDPSGSGYIGYDDFVSISAVRIAQRSPAEEMKKAFELFDEDGNPGPETPTPTTPTHPST